MTNGTYTGPRTEPLMIVNSSADAAKLMLDMSGELGRAYVGPIEERERMTATIAAGGHMLLEGTPGIGKTFLADTVAMIIDGQSGYVQGHAENRPHNFIGWPRLDLSSRVVEFEKGPLFSNIMVADEFNRNNKDAQAAVLQAMNNGHVTVDGVTMPLERPFTVVATQNPHDEFEDTFPLTSVNLDRFMTGLTLPAPSSEDLRVIYRRDLQHIVPATITTTAEVAKLAGIVDNVPTSGESEIFASDLITMLGNPEKADTFFVSARAMKDTMRMAKALALMKSSGEVTPDDIAKIAPHTLAHRIRRSQKTIKSRTSSSELVEQAVDDLMSRI